MTLVRLVVALLLAGAAVTPLRAQQGTLSVSVQGQKFQPAEVRAKAGEAITLKVTNNDAAPIEFQSATLRAAALVSPHTTATVQVPALPRGRYAFFDLAHAGTQGVLILE